jgi:hypothetical protein
VFAVNEHYKLFRSGRLFRLTDRPLEEIEVDPLAMTDADREAEQALNAVIKAMLADSTEPPLVDAYGRGEHAVPAAAAGDTITGSAPDPAAADSSASPSTERRR